MEGSMADSYTSIDESVRESMKAPTRMDYMK